MASSRGRLSGHGGVEDLCAGKTFDFTSAGDAPLKGFDEPVALYEVRVG